MIITYEGRTFETFYALQCLGKYWVENERWITADAQHSEEAGKPTWVPQDPDEEGEYRHEMQMARHVHDDVLFPTFRYSCIIMLYSVVERELKRLVETLEKDRGKQKLSLDDIKGASFLHRISKFVDVFFNYNMTQIGEYRSLDDLRKIRNCLVHSRGEVDGNKGDGKYLMAQTHIIPGFFAFEGATITIEAECLEYFLGKAWMFFQILFQQIGWTIDSWEPEAKSAFPKNLLAEREGPAT